MSNSDKGSGGWGKWRSELALHLTVAKEVALRPTESFHFLKEAASVLE